MENASTSKMINIAPGAHVKLVEFVAESITLKGGKNAEKAAEALTTECTEMIGQARAPALIRRLLTAEACAATLARGEGEEGSSDVEAVFQILFSLLFKVEEAGEVPLLVTDICKAVVDTTEGDKLLRLRILTNLYNILPSGSREQFEALLTIIRFAMASSQNGLLSSFFIKQGQEWVELFDLETGDQRTLYLLMADSLVQSQHSHEAQKFLLKYLATYEDEADAKALSAVKEHAARGAVGAIRFPIVSFTEGHNVLALQAVKQLEGDKKYKNLYNLLRVFSTEKLQAYLDFCKSCPNTLQENGLEHDQCLENMRLLSLCSLASEHQEVPYSLIASTLQVEAGEVESWVVRGCQVGLLQAKMDQLHQVVMVSRSTHRQFGKQEWDHLSEKLNQWKQNVQDLLLTARKSQEVFAVTT